MDLERDKEEGVPEHGVRIALKHVKVTTDDNCNGLHPQYLPHHDVLRHPLRDELVAVHRVQGHAEQDGEQGADKSTDKKLLDRLEAGVLAG